MAVEHNHRAIHPNASAVTLPLVGTPTQINTAVAIARGRQTAAAANQAAGPSNQVPLHAFIEDHTAQITRG